MSDPSQSNGEVRACTSVLIGILSKMRAKGLLTQEEVKDLFDQPMLLLEQSGLYHSDPVGRQTHAILGQLLSVVEKLDRSKSP